MLVKVEGQAYDRESKLAVPQFMLVNKRTNVGLFADNEGRFNINMLQSDTLLISALGYKLKAICLRDSVPKKKYNLIITLDKLSYTLNEIVIFPTRTLKQIDRDISKLGAHKKPSWESINAFQSPITYLYERFSKFGKSKRKVEIWENEDLKRDLLKELFRLYIKYDIIDLNDQEFDAFVKYLNFSDEFMKSATQLELVLAIKGKYESFKHRWK